MKKLQIDLMVYPTKVALLTYLTTIVEDMFSPNYDALIDALTAYDKPLAIEFIHIDAYEDKQALVEIFDIIHNENNLIAIKK